MKTAVLSTYGETCGIATYSEALVLALGKLGVQTEVLAPRLVPGDTPRGDQPVRLWRRRWASIYEAAATFCRLRSMRPDVVHAQVNLGLFSPRFLLSLSELCRIAKLPLIATMHARAGGSRARRWELERTLFALRHAELVVHDGAHLYGTTRQHVHVIPHGTAPARERTSKDARHALGLSRSGPVVAHFGFLHPDKGIDEVMVALAELRAERFPDLLYWICGGTFQTRTSRAYLGHLKERARDLGMAEHVHVSGEFVSDETAILELQAADLVVLNYRTGNNQGTSGAARRALASGRPLAVSRAPVFDDLRSAAYTLGRPLASEIEMLLSKPDLRAEIGARGRRFAEANSWGRIAEEHVRLYEQVRRGLPRAGER